MTIRRILYHGDPLLWQRCDPVVAVDGSVREVIQDLADTLYSTTGLGLAAPQIGVNKCVFIYDLYRAGDSRTYKVLINPRITWRNGHTVSEAEGCKSAPKLRVDVPRSTSIKVEGMNESGEQVVFHAEGFESIVIQHEMDHLIGKLLTGHLALDALDSYERQLARIVHMEGDPWYSRNLAAIERRLRPLASAPEGVLFRQHKANYEIVVLKDGSQVQLFFKNPNTGNAERKFSGIMSRIDLEAPLTLLGVYTQVMMLSLLWKPEPKSVYLLGFGGGRVPMVFHHYYPDLIIESTEIDRNVVSIAKRFFGIEIDNRMQVFVEEGRNYLEKQPVNVSYDIILVDCYTGAGFHPFSLSTKEFYHLCKSHLTNGGVVVSNFVRSDPLFREKMHTFMASFTYVRQFQSEIADVFFGSDAELRGPDVVRRADELYERYSFPFPFAELTKNMRPIYLHETEDSGCVILSDATNRDGLPGGVSPQDPIFYGVKRNDVCPCGSGKKFKSCHGRL